MRLAIAGSGKIVREALPVLSGIPEIQVKALWVREHSLENGKALAEQYGRTAGGRRETLEDAGAGRAVGGRPGVPGTQAADQTVVPEVLTDYSKMLRLPDIDAVYIGLVNTAHFSFAKEALLAGKHVIVEKPLTVTLGEAQELMNLAQERSLCVLEGMTLLYGRMLPQMRRMMKKIGQVRLCTGNYSQYSSRYDDYRRGIVKPAFDPDLAGGALMDINIYNLALTEALFGMPQRAQYFANRGFNGVDTSGTAVLTYPGFQVSLSGAKDCDGESGMIIQGEEGMVCLRGKPNMPERLECVLRGTAPESTGPEGSVPGPGGPEDAGPRVIALGDGSHRMKPEFAEFARIIDCRDHAAAQEAMAHSLAVMRIVDMMNSDRMGGVFTVR